MSHGIGTLGLRARLKVRGKLQFRAADGSVIKEVDIVDGSLPVVAQPPALPAEPTAHAPESPHVDPA
jgi:hypothetical protein